MSADNFRLSCQILRERVPNMENGTDRKELHMNNAKKVILTVAMAAVVAVCMADTKTT